MATKSEEAYQKLAEQMRDSEAAEICQMFGMPTLKFNGKAFAGLFGGEMTFKLAGDAHALALKGAKLFDPMGIGRVMKEWVQSTSRSCCQMGITRERCARIYPNASCEEAEDSLSKKMTVSSAKKSPKNPRSA
jgi:hypothetical protein